MFLLPDFKSGRAAESNRATGYKSGGAKEQKGSEEQIESEKQ